MSNEKLRKFQQSIFNIRSLFLFPAWVLSLVVLLSVPATKTIYLWDFVVLGEAKALVVKVGQIDAGFRFGLFGYCFDGLDAKLLGIGGDIIHASCVKTSIGIHIDPKVANPLGLDHLENDLNNSFRAVIAFHVITFVAVTLAFIFNLLPRSVARSSLNDIKNNPRLAMGYANKLTFPFICLITAAAFVSFIIDIAVAKAAQGLLEAGTINVPIGDIHFDAHTGPIPWIMLTVFLLLLILLVNEKTDFIGKCIPSLSVKKPEVSHQDKVPMSEVDREAARPGASSHGEQWSQVQLDERQRSQDGNPYTQHY